MWNREQVLSFTANFLGSTVMCTKVPVRIGKPIRYLNSSVMAVSDEFEWLGVELVGCASR